MLDGSMLHHAAATLYRVLIGFGLAVAVGLPLGVLMGRFRPVEHFVLPLASALMPIPSLAWVPVFILWFGLGDTVTMLIVFYAALFPMLLNTWSGVRSVNPIWLRAAGAMGADERALFWKVIIPGASPFIIAGLRQSFLRSWIAVIGAEMLAASELGPGLGHLRRQAISQCRRDDGVDPGDRPASALPPSGWCSARSSAPPSIAGAWRGWRRGKRRCAAKWPDDRCQRAMYGAVFTRCPAFAGHDNDQRTAMAHIEARDISLIYDTPGGTVPGVSGVSFSMEASEFLCIVGPSGCGKSTLLNIIAGFLTPTAGEIRIGGQPVRGYGMDRGVVFQDFAQLFPWRTALGNVAFGLEMKGMPKAERETIALEQLRLVKLEKFAKSYPHHLSGGMQQRVAIARALAYNPAVLLMDEPFAALDALTRDDMQRLLADVWRSTRKTVIYVTHNLAEAVYLADRVVVMTPHPGKVKTEVPIRLPRPRDPLSVEFLDYQKELLRLLGQETRA